MDLVDDIDLVATCLGRDVDLLDQFADVFNAVVGCGVQFEDIHGHAVVERHAVFALVAGFHIGGGVGAIDGLGQDAGTGSLAHAARTAEKKRLGQLVGTDGVFERCSDMLLAHHAVESGGAVFACGNYKIRHSQARLELFTRVGLYIIDFAKIQIIIDTDKYNSARARVFFKMKWTKVRQKEVGKAICRCGIPWCGRWRSPRTEV